MVERYSAGDIMWSIDNVEMSPTEDGEFVRYYDYAALEAQLAERVKVTVAALDRLERAAMAYERLGKLSKDDEKTRKIRKETIAELASARSAILTAAQEAGKP